MRIKELIAFTIFALLSSQATSSTSSDAVVLFDALCIGAEADINVIEKMATAAGAKPISQESLQADQAIAQHGGKGYVLNRNNHKFFIMVTTKRGCSIIAQDTSAPEIKKLLEQNYPIAKQNEGESGTQVITSWKIVHPSMHKGGTIVLNAAKPGFGADNAISLGFLPASVANQ